jgi:hypothetical protein
MSAIVRTKRNSESGSLHAAMLAANGPITVADLAKQAGTTIERAAHHCDFWSKPQRSRGVQQAAYLRKDGGWVIAPGVRIAFA